MKRIVFALALMTTPGLAQTSLPSAATPGAINPDVTQASIKTTICVLGWTRTVRPPVSYTSHLKVAQIAAAGYDDVNPRDYEEDHLIPLELGGAPRDPRNLWPQPWHPADGWGAGKKDKLENRLREMVCAGTMTLDDARVAIVTNWEAAFEKYVP